MSYDLANFNLYFITVVVLLHMKVSVAIVTYKRAWALPYCLQSVANQKRMPDEVVIVLKPSGDKSEKIIDKFKDVLNIKLVIQEEGNFTDAVSMEIKHSTGDVILFLDDAVAHEEWVARYVDLFAKYKDMGGASGLVYKALLNNGGIIKTKMNSSTRPCPLSLSRTENL